MGIDKCYLIGRSYKAYNGNNRLISWRWNMGHVIHCGIWSKTHACDSLCWGWRYGHRSRFPSLARITMDHTWMLWDNCYWGQNDLATAADTAIISSRLRGQSISHVAISIDLIAGCLSVLENSWAPASLFKSEWLLQFGIFEFVSLTSRGIIFIFCAVGISRNETSNGYFSNYSTIKRYWDLDSG